MNPLSNLTPMGIPYYLLKEMDKSYIISEDDGWYLLNMWLPSQDKRELTIYHLHPFNNKAYGLEKYTEKCSLCGNRAPKRFIAVKAIGNVRS